MSPADEPSRTDMTTTRQTRSIEDTAIAFSTHRFSEIYDVLAPDVTWTARGAGPAPVGASAVIEACEHSLAEIIGADSTLLELRTIVGKDSVAVDTVTRYVDSTGGSCVVASVDLYDFAADGTLTTITSYAAELDV